MVVSTTPPIGSPWRDLHFMGDSSRWLRWPFLPLMRRHPDGQLDYCVLIDAQAVCQRTGYRCTVFRTNLFLMPPSIDQFLELPKQVYETFDELIAAGWHVD